MLVVDIVLPSLDQPWVSSVILNDHDGGIRIRSDDRLESSELRFEVLTESILQERLFTCQHALGEGRLKRLLEEEPLLFLVVSEVVLAHSVLELRHRADREERGVAAVLRGVG